MKEIYLGTTFNTKVLHSITDTLKEWDYSLVEGEGLYCSTMGKYGHIQLEISKSEKEFNLDFLVNNLNENQLPLDFLDGVVKVLQFFSSYVQGIKGESIGFKFEITDGSFHPIDSKNLIFK